MHGGIGHEDVCVIEPGIDEDAHRRVEDPTIRAQHSLEQDLADARVRTQLFVDPLDQSAQSRVPFPVSGFRDRDVTQGSGGDQVEQRILVADVVVHRHV